MTPDPPSFRHALSNLTRPLCILDSEWTRASTADARLVSIAIAKLLPDGTAQTREWFVNPGAPIDPGATAVHGITNADVADRPLFRTVAAEVAAFLEGADIGGYSVSSDIQILERELAAAEVTLDTDTLRIVDGLRLWQKREPRKLTDAYQRFVGPIPEDLQPHDALDDVRMTVAVIERMANGQTAAELHAEAHPDMVDPAGKFRRDEHDRIVFAFGKHRGDPTDDHPDFLAWILNKDFPPSTLAVARRELDRIRPPAPEPNPGAQPVNTEANSIDDGEIPF